MRSIRSRIELVASVAIAAVAALGCSEPLAAPIPAVHGDAPEAAPRRGGTLHLASFGDIRSLDPAAISDALSSEAIELLFAGLVDYDAAGKIVPDLAERWDLSPDGLTYTFYLHEGVRFHDGEELTADDVKRSIARALDPKTPNPFASFYENLAETKVEGRYVVSLRLKERDATFLSVLAMQPLRPVCKSGGSTYSDTWLPCGAGPFKLLPGGWDRGRSLTVVRHDGYFRPGMPLLDAVNVTYRMSILTQPFKLQSGDLDAIRDFTQGESLRFLSDPRWRVYGQLEPDRSIFGENMNTEVPPFDNVEIRRAVACAVDREHYRLLRATNVFPTGNSLPPGLPGSDPSVPGQKTDLACALEHMRRAGYPYDPATGKGGWEPRVEYTAYREGFNSFAAQVLQQDLARIGIRIEIKVVSFATFLATTHRRRKSAMSPQGWNQDYPDASDFYESLFWSKSINEEDTSNTSFFKNPEFDALVEKAHHELDPTARRREYADAERILVDQAPWAFTHSYRWYNVHQPYVKEWRVHAVWSYDLMHTWLDRAADVIAIGTPFSGDRRRAR